MNTDPLTLTELERLIAGVASGKMVLGVLSLLSNQPTSGA